MTRKRGYFAIGIDHPKNRDNVGTLWRSSLIFGAQYVFTIGHRYHKQASDTLKTWRHIPLFHYETADDFYVHMPYDCRLIGIEIAETAHPIKNYCHPERAIYVLGAEDHGLTTQMMRLVHDLIVIPGDFCLNVAVAGSIVLYDRWIKLSSVQGKLL